MDHGTGSRSQIPRGAAGAAVTLEETVRPVREAGLVDLVETDHAPAREVRFEPSPEHSPGLAT